MNEYELNDFILEIFDYYRSNGFPYYNKNHDEMIHEMNNMDKYFKRGKVLITNNIIKQTMHCLGTAWTFFPHSWNVKCNGNITPFEAFTDDVKFKKVIRKRLRRGTYMNDSGIRKELKTSTGIQAVSNFRPSSARAIYDKYAGSGVVYDPSCGFGGRLIGAISSPKVKKYIGVEPSTQTYNGLIQLKKTLENKDIELHHIGSEDFKPENIDLVFTSPPYYNTEKYSNESTQSWKKFSTKKSWLNGFLRKTINNCYDSLKRGGFMIINIANVKTYPTLEQDFKDIMDEKFNHVTTLKYTLSLINKHGFKYEPVFVYQKH